MANGEAKIFTEATERVKYEKNVVLGKGRMGNYVFRGQYENNVEQPTVAAIKRVQYLSKDDFEKIKKEIKANEALHHENVARYINSAHNDDFVFIVMELCLGTLENVENNLTVFKDPIVPDEIYQNEVKFFNFKKHLLFGVAKGIDYLHQNRHVHRDLKPQNVLIKKYPADEKWGFIAAICDLELTRQFKDGRAEYSVTQTNAGSFGWTAAEVLDETCTKVTNKVDIFAYGCIVHYLLSTDRAEQRVHPFGGIDDRNKKISQNSRTTYLYKEEDLMVQSLQKSFCIIHHGSDFLPICDIVLADMLIQCCVWKAKTKRFDIKNVLKHPLFWGNSERMKFLEDNFNEFKDDYQKPGCPVKYIEREWKKIMEELDLKMFIPEAVHYIERNKEKMKQRPLKEDNMLTLFNFLMRTIRNFSQHWKEVQSDLSYESHLTLSSSDTAYLSDHLASYFFERIPFLFPVIYNRFIPHSSAPNTRCPTSKQQNIEWQLLIKYCKHFKEQYKKYLENLDNAEEIIKKYKKLGVDIMKKLQWPVQSPNFQF